MPPSPSLLRLPGFVDERRMSPFQYGVITLCCLVMLLDGFDTQAISYMAPLIAHEWHLSVQLLGPIFSSAPVGVMAGYLLLSPLADRVGHKRVIIGATVGFAGCTLLAAWAGDVTQLIVLRFCTGLALGAACPSCVAMAGEFSPKRRRATLVVVIYSGFALGIALAGVVAGWLLPPYGWRSMFWAGGLTPLVLVPLSLSGRRCATYSPLPSSLGPDIVGGLNSLIALTTVFYPASMRSTAVGWTLGVGRFGGIVGPLVVGAALAADWPEDTVVCVMAFPMTAAGLGILLLGRRYGRRRGTAAATRSV